MTADDKVDWSTVRQLMADPPRRSPATRGDWPNRYVPFTPNLDYRILTTPDYEVVIWDVPGGAEPLPSVDASSGSDMMRLMERLTTAFQGDAFANELRVLQLLKEDAVAIGWVLTEDSDNRSDRVKLGRILTFARGEQRLWLMAMPAGPGKLITWGGSADRAAAMAPPTG